MRANLRLSDLEQQADHNATKLMNVKVPTSLNDAIDEMASNLECSKTDAVIALLNEGLDAFAEKRHEFKPSAQKRPRRGRPPVRQSQNE
jgi:hypothetical protein